MFKKDLLQDKRILITGGGTGLGKEMANHFAEHGAELYICGRRDNVLQETADEMISFFPGLKSLRSIKSKRSSSLIRS